MKIAFLTAGGIAPCLSSSISMLIQEYNNQNIDCEFIGYLHGYKGLLTGEKIKISNDFDFNAVCGFGGSFIGNSRVKLTNIEDCIDNGYVQKGKIPLEIAANQLKEDKIDILHTIGGDDTNSTAGELVKFSLQNNYNLTVVGLPKTIDNDVYPIKQTLGAYTAAEQTSLFFQNIVNENTTSSRQLIIHEIMGRHCGWLTAYSAYLYRKSLQDKNFIPELLLSKERWDIHAIYVPEINYNFENEYLRLRKIMDTHDCVNIFFSEGAGLETVIKDMIDKNEEVAYDAFGHARIDNINPGQWFAKIFKEKLSADKVLVQKSGYFARSSSPNRNDLELIKKTVILVVKEALSQKNGVVGIRDSDSEVSLIDFEDIRGGKPFNFKSDWFDELLKNIKQPV